MTKEEKNLQLKKQKDKQRVSAIKAGILALKLHYRGMKVPKESFDRAAKELITLKKEREKEKKVKSK